MEDAATRRGSRTVEGMSLSQISTAMARRVGLLLFSSFLVLLFLTVPCAAQGQGTKFPCSDTARCQALAGYVPDNDTTYEAIKSLFQVKSIHALFGANNVNASTPASAKVSAGALVKVPFPCACANGTGVSDRRPVYTVVSGDSLYNISTQTFKGFVVYPQIVAVNSIIKDPSNIDVGWKLWIPLPCSCDAVGGAEAVHLAHVVAKGSNLTVIAGQFGTTEETLAQINSISDPKDLQQGQILDVPIRACNSSIRSDSHDRALRVADGSYALTANNCVKCSCSSSSSQLQCEIAQDLKNQTKSRCQAGTCRIGNVTAMLGESVPGACGSTRCEYAGYNGSIILTTVANQSACGTPGTGAPASGARALRPQLFGPSRWARQLLLLAPLGTALLLSAFLW